MDIEFPGMNDLLKDTKENLCNLDTGCCWGGMTGVVNFTCIFSCFYRKPKKNMRCRVGIMLSDGSLSVSSSDYLKTCDSG